MFSISPRDEATAIIKHYLRALTTATGRRWTPDNDRDMQRLNVLMGQIADEEIADTIPAYTRPAAPRQLDTRVTQVLEREPRPQDNDPQYRAWQEQRRRSAHSESDQAALDRMLGNGSRQSER